MYLHLIKLNDNSSPRVLFLLLIMAGLADVNGAKQTVEQYLDRCIQSKYHKLKPGRESEPFIQHCQPWTNSSCCTFNTTKKIKDDVVFSLHGMVLDQCPPRKMSQKCRRHFERDTCFYECSPNFAPWIITDTVSKKTRKERTVDIPLCTSECSKWYEDCRGDYTCNDNWAKNWNWTNKGSPKMCTKACKTFSDYFRSPKVFCDMIFNHSFKSVDSEDCISMWPDTPELRMKNRKVAEKAAREKLKYMSIGTIEKGQMNVFLSSICFVFVNVIFTNL